MSTNKKDIARPLAWSLAALSLAAGFIGLVVSLFTVEGWLVTHMMFGPVTTLAYGLMGALVAGRQPHNAVGWIFSAVGFFAGLTLLASNSTVVCDWGGARAACNTFTEWLILWVWIPTSFLPLSFVLLLFPDGRLPSPRWRPVAWAAGLSLSLFVLTTALHPRPSVQSPPPYNPFGVAGLVPFFAALDYVVTPLFVISAIGAPAALIVRFRRARGVERQQIKWLAYGSVVAMLGIAVMSIWSALYPNNPAAYELAIGSVWVALTVIVLAAGNAILRHRLYDIDLIINRTLVYGALSAGIVGLYVLLVGGLGALFQASGNPMVALLATGLAALLVQPLRARLQRGVNRLMYGDRDDPYTVISRLSQQLKSSLTPSAVLPSIAQAIAQTLKLPYVALQLAYGTRLEVAAAYGMPVGDPLRLPLVYQAETVGQLLVAPRAPGESFTAAERRLLEDIALQAGAAAHAVRLAAELQRSRERLVSAREEERRRLRRNLHDGLGPQLASLTLTIAAARELLRRDVDAADMLLQELSIHTQTAIGDIRRVVYDLRPPALDDLGLVMALREQAGSYRQLGLQIRIDAPERLPPLPAAVEVAAYRIAQEALTNVVRHARARTCTVALQLGDALVLEICDDGVGLPPNGRAGVGLSSMRERTAELGGAYEIESAPGQGTRIRARLPVLLEDT